MQDSEKKKQGWIACLLEYAKGGKGKLIASVVLSILSVVSGILPYYCMYRILNDFIQETVQMNAMMKWCLIVLAAFAVKVIFFSLSTGLSHYAAYNILENLRLKVANRFMHAPLGKVAEHSIGEIKGIMVDKIDNIEPPLAHVIPEGCGHFVLPLVSFAVLWAIDFRIALASLITAPLSFVCMGLTFKISGKNFDKYNSSNTYMNSTIVEYIEGIEVIKAFGRAGMSYEKYAKAITEYKKFVIQWMSSTWITMKLAFALFPSTILGILPVSLWLAAENVISIGQVAFAVMISMSMVGSLAQLEVFANSLKQVQLTVEELQDYLCMEELPEVEQRVEISRYDIELRKVRFSYTEDDLNEVIHGVDLTMPQGSFTALVGPSGGGKSTIARLIARFWDVTEGQICIGGIKIQDIPLLQLSEMVSFVTQDNFLFQCSLMENIRLGNPKATDEEVYEAAKAAQCEEFIAKLPNGYHTTAGEAGKCLSGGEKQRIAIARMILKNAPIVILDEATAFTDPENEEKIQRSIAALTKGRTVLVIAHRLSTIKNADNIVVLKDGNVIAQGTQKQLLENCQLYKEMWEKHIGARKWAVQSKDKEV